MRDRGQAALEYQLGSLCGGVDQSRLERYSQTLGAVPLKLFTTDSRWPGIQAELGATPWQPLVIVTLTKSVDQVMKQRRYANSPATELLRGLARIL
jgi:hypothetical protein